MGSCLAHRLVEAPVVGVDEAMNQQHGFFIIGIAHQAPPNGSFVPAPDVVAWAQALPCCSGASWRGIRLDGRLLP